MRNSTKSAVAAALSKPMPSGLKAALANVERADAAFKSARAALDDFRSAGTASSDQAVAEAQRALHEAAARRDVADRLGEEEDTPTDADLERLQGSLERAIALRDGRDARLAAYTDEMERRRAALDGALEVSGKILTDWKKPVIEAANAQLAQAAQMAGEALKVAETLEPWRGFYDRVRLPNLDGETHHGPDSVALPADIADATRAHFRAMRQAGR